MINAILGLLLRHGLTILGGALAAPGLHLGAVDINTVVGGVAAIAGVGLSALNKVKAVAKLNAATNSFVNLNR